MKRNEPYTEIIGYVGYTGGKVPVKRNHYPFGTSGWGFTEEEVKSIVNALRSPKRGKPRVAATEKDIMNFIMHLEHFCSAKKYWILDKPKRAEARKNREQVLTDCKAALGHLRLIHQCEKALICYNDLAVFGSEEDDPVTGFKMRSWEEARAALQSLEKFIQTLETYHQAEEKKRGRDNADSDNLVKIIRVLYQQYLGEKPKGHKNSAFTDIVKAVYAILELPSEDPSRAIDAALKAE